MSHQWSGIHTIIDADALKQYFNKNLEKPPRSIFGVMAQMELKELIDIINECVDKQPTIEPDWAEPMVICDNCGHAIHVKRTDAVRI